MAYTQATELQDLLRETAHKPDMAGVAVSSLARTWLELERLKREIRMKPKPRAIDVSQSVRSKKLSRVSPFHEPAEVALAPATKTSAQERQDRSIQPQDAPPARQDTTTTTATEPAPQTPENE